MRIDRGKQTSAGMGEHRISYCLDRLQAAADFCGGVDWKTRVVPSLTLEELIGALVAAELDLEDYREDVEHYSGSDLLGRFYGFTCPNCGAYSRTVDGVRFADGRTQILCPECEAVDTIEPLDADAADGLRQVVR